MQYVLWLLVHFEIKINAKSKIPLVVMYIVYTKLNVPALRL